MRRITGFKSFAINGVMPQSDAIFNIPFQKHIVALMLIISRMQLSQASRQAETVWAVVLFITEQIKEKQTIKIHI